MGWYSLFPKAKQVQGEVYLVGAGPGDPELLTLKAYRLMQQCDVVLYDHLIPEEILEQVRADATRIAVGKPCGTATLSQQEINQMMIFLAQEGKRVLRLKSGDPLVFGRLGEEVDALREADISYSVVPGITAASACATALDIPLTHRELAHSCTLVTGHTANGKLDLDWKSLAKQQQSLVFYMGLNNMKAISRQLQQHGLPADTPAAVVMNGSRPTQKTLTATLATLPGIAKAQGYRSPALLIVGDVVKLAATSTATAVADTHWALHPMTETSRCIASAQ